MIQVTNTTAMIRSIASTAMRRKRSTRLLTSPSPSPSLKSLNRHQALSATGAAFLSTQSVSSHRQHKSQQDAPYILWASIAGLGASVSWTRCDDDDDEEEDDEGEEDPYDSLPEKDEPTHCSICLTYRQGPCRPYWRKVEACTKDNELKTDDSKDDGETKAKGESEKEEKGGDETDDDKSDDSKDNLSEPPCLKYMLPWIDCATSFRNLYSLIELDTNYTAGIADLEAEAKEHLCWTAGSAPSVDWTNWQVYVQANEWKLPKKKKTKKSAETKQPEKVSLWKTLDQNQDPDLVEVEATVASCQADGILECAYALDQDGHVIGFAYGTKPKEVQEKEGDDAGDSVTMTIRLLPTRTRSVTLAAAYTQPQKEGAKETDPLDSHIYKSRPMSLNAMGRKSSSKK